MTTPLGDCGYASPLTRTEKGHTMEESPFSDPLADGVVNQMAAMRALKQGATVGKILSLIGKIRKKSEIPIILFTYLNPILKYGFEKFAKEASKKGVDGILVLDLPPEEAEDYKRKM